MTKYNFTLTLLFTMMVSSCVTIDQVDIDYLKSAKVIFPTEIKRVAIVNNVTTNNRKSIINKEDSLNIIKRFESTFQGDGKVVSESFAKNIAAANYFDQVIICDSALRKKDLISREQELSQEDVKELTTDLGADMILSVEDIKIKTDERTIYDNGLFHSIIDAKVSPIIKIYIPTRTKPLMAVAPEDEIFWDGYGISVEEARRKIINEKEVVQEASDFAGEIPIQYLLPTWESSSRSYYSSGCLELRDASVFVREESWDEALKLWMDAYKSKKSKIKMRSAFNIALYYEVHDDIEKAVEWANKAHQIAAEKEKVDEKSINQDTLKLSQDYLLTTRYLLILNERKADLPTLDLQMKRFNGNF